MQDTTSNWSAAISTSNKGAGDLTVKVLLYIKFKRSMKAASSAVKTRLNKVRENNIKTVCQLMTERINNFMCLIWELLEWELLERFKLPDA